MKDQIVTSRSSELERPDLYINRELSWIDFNLLVFKAAHVTTLSPDGMTAEQQLVAVRGRLAPLLHDVRCYWHNTLLPQLAEQHIAVLDYEQLDAEQRDAMLKYFELEIFPVF